MGEYDDHQDSSVVSPSRFSPGRFNQQTVQPLMIVPADDSNHRRFSGLTDISKVLSASPIAYTVWCHPFFVNIHAFFRAEECLLS
ncbi:unnamed protein product [Clavelina lepadiformis]|uniref:Uncharacterized protein n=1 Tax=Clavelina lepadiformis TaxID=159417 RepID=A0ABP0FU43_CLALP